MFAERYFQPDGEFGIDINLRLRPLDLEYCVRLERKICSMRHGHGAAATVVVTPVAYASADTQNRQLVDTSKPTIN